ncbi:O-methyltransferase [bacterium]|nr:MAG: O-methyltransferase [bacterium]
MDQAVFTAVDTYLEDRLLSPDPTLEAALEAIVAAGMPSISVSAPQGRLLNLVAKMHGAKRILEVGTLGGYSTIWLARALPADGRLTTLELDSKHAEVARTNVDRAGVGEKVEIRVGSAVETMPKLEGSYDLVFIDADKANIPTYWKEALRLTMPGSLIIVDNVIRNGAVADASTTDESVLGVRKLMDLVRGDDRVETTAIQTVGSKGYDGFLLALVK